MSIVIDLSKNEFLYEHPVLRANSLPKLSAQEICRYSMKPKLIDKLSAFHQIAPENFCLTNGAEQALKTVFLAAGKMQDTTLFVPNPTWEYYWKLATKYGATAVPYYYNETNNGAFELDVACLEKGINKAKKAILLIASPSNPLGCRTDDETIHELADMVGKKGYTILDQAYVGFSREREESLAETLQTVSNVMVVRSLSKYYGIAGLRVGFIAASPDIQKVFSIFGDYLGFNSFADKVATECLNRHAEFADIANQMILERERLEEFFSSLPGYKAYKSSANFFLVRVPQEGFAPYMLENGIKVRTFQDEVLLDCVRITVPPKGVGDRLQELSRRFYATRPMKGPRPHVRSECNS